MRVGGADGDGHDRLGGAAARRSLTRRWGKSRAGERAGPSRDGLDGPQRWLLGRQELLELCRRLRPAEEVALAQQAPKVPQRLELLGGLDALGDDVQPERVTE